MIVGGTHRVTLRARTSVPPRFNARSRVWSSAALAFSYSGCEILPLLVLDFELKQFFLEGIQQKRAERSAAAGLGRRAGRATSTSEAANCGMVVLERPTTKIAPAASTSPKPPRMYQRYFSRGSGASMGGPRPPPGRESRPAAAPPTGDGAPALSSPAVSQGSGAGDAEVERLADRGVRRHLNDGVGLARIIHRDEWRALPGGELHALGQHHDKMLGAVYRSRVDARSGRCTAGGRRPETGSPPVAGGK